MNCGLNLLPRLVPTARLGFLNILRSGDLPVILRERREETMSELGHERTSAEFAGMSAPRAEAVVSGLKADIRALRSAIAGTADVHVAGRDVRS
jgi:hypothetical protein